MMKQVLLVMYFFLFLVSCVKREDYPFYDGVGKKPVYISRTQLLDVKNLPQQPIKNTGAIFLLDTLFFMLEYKKGIHVFNVKDSLNTRYLTFFNIPAINDFTIRNKRLYADSWRDLVTIDWTDLYKISVVNRAENAFNPIWFPPLYRGYFECADESKVILDWIDADLKDAKCYNFN